MPLLLDVPAAFPGAPAANAPAPELDGPGLAVSALVARWHLDPTEFQVRVHELSDGTGFPRGSILVTVSNRRVRASRTYLGHPHSDAWTGELEQDLHAGVFSG